MLSMTTFVLNTFACEDDPISGVSYIKSQPHLRCDVLTLAEKLIPLLTFTVFPIMCIVLGIVFLEYRSTSVSASGGPAAFASACTH